VRPNQSDCADHNYQDHGKHHCILSNVLAAFLAPQFSKYFFHNTPPLRELYTAIKMKPARCHLTSEAILVCSGVKFAHSTGEHTKSESSGQLET